MTEIDKKTSYEEFVSIAKEHMNQKEVQKAVRLEQDVHLREDFSIRGLLVPCFPDKTRQGRTRGRAKQIRCENIR